MIRYLVYFTFTKYLIAKVVGQSEPDIDLEIREEKLERIGEFTYLSSSIRQ